MLKKDNVARGDSGWRRDIRDVQDHKVKLLHDRDRHSVEQVIGADRSVKCIPGFGGDTTGPRSPATDGDIHASHRLVEHFERKRARNESNKCCFFIFDYHLTLFDIVRGYTHKTNHSR